MPAAVAWGFNTTMSRKADRASLKASAHCESRSTGLAAVWPPLSWSELGDAGERDNTIIVSLFPSPALTRGSGRIRVRVGEAFFRPVPASVEDEIGPSFGPTAFPDLRHFCETAIDAFAVRVAGA